MPTEASSGAVNYAVAQQDTLKLRHYVLNNRKSKGWVPVATGRVDYYQERYGDDFCLVIAGDPAIPGDFYAIPWGEASAHFVEKSKYHPTQWKIYLQGPPHVFQFQLDRTDLLSRPWFDASQWYGNYAALEVAVQTEVDTILVELIAGGATFPEGQMIAVLHYRRERNPRLVAQAKKRFQDNHGGRLFCEVCTMEFHHFYGVLGEGFIEAHHSVPLKSLTEDAQSRVADLRMVCANCHRMLHRGAQWLTVAELRDVITPAKEAGYQPEQAYEVS
jgi:hypothetical protein